MDGGIKLRLHPLDDERKIFDKLDQSRHGCPSKKPGPFGSLSVDLVFGSLEDTSSLSVGLSLHWQNPQPVLPLNEAIVSTVVNMTMSSYPGRMMGR